MATVTVEYKGIDFTVVLDGSGRPAVWGERVENAQETDDYHVSDIQVAGVSVLSVLSFEAHSSIETLALRLPAYRL